MKLRNRLSANDEPLVFKNFPGDEPQTYADSCRAALKSSIDSFTGPYFKVAEASEMRPGYGELVALQAFQVSHILGSNQFSSFVELPSSEKLALLEFDFSQPMSWVELFEKVNTTLARVAAEAESLYCIESVKQLNSVGTLLFLYASKDLEVELQQLAGSAVCFGLNILEKNHAEVSYTTIGIGLAENQFAFYRDTFSHLCRQVTEEPHGPVSTAALWSSELKHDLIVKTNTKTFDLTSAASLPAQLEACREAVPSKTALICGDNKLDFSQLATTVERIASGLQQIGIKAGDKVATYMTRDIEWACTQLACMSLGAVYTPIDPSYPVLRISHMLNQAEVKCLIYDQTLPQALEEEMTNVSLLSYNKVVDDTGMMLLDLDGMLDPMAVAYIQFTSGTTGLPKGAMVRHQGMLNHIFAKIVDLELSKDDVIAQTASQCFDISLWQLLTGLYTQSTTVIYPDEVIWDIDDYMHYTHQHEVTVLEVVPSYLDLLMEEQGDVEQLYFSTLALLMVTGERVTLGQLNRWFEHYPNIPVFNAYGPTEASDDITHFKIECGFNMSSVPIGKPIHNATIYILDEQQNLLPYGSVGEICVAGICVGAGYINRPEETSRAFMHDPVQPEQGRYMYRTGDVGRWLPDGNLAFLGRRDQQVKVNGVRIELTEIEETMSLLEGIKDVAVLCVNNDIVGIYSTLQNCSLDKAEVRSRLKQSLPQHLIPNDLIHKDSLPLNINGKVDKKALTLELQG